MGDPPFKRDMSASPADTKASLLLTPASRTIRFYFSFRSPFAFIAFHRLFKSNSVRSAAENGLKIDFVPVW